jgi:hypothetical protein
MSDFPFYEAHLKWLQMGALEPTFCDWWHQRGLCNPVYLELLEGKMSNLNESLADDFEASLWAPASQSPMGEA